VEPILNGRFIPLVAPLRSVFRFAHAPLTCSDSGKNDYSAQYVKLLWSVALGPSSGRGERPHCQALD